jgi:prepilin peptidase CpaA
MSAGTAFVLAASAVFLLCIAAFDFKQRRVPNNALLLGAALTALAAAANSQPMPWDALASGKGLLLAALIYLPFYLIGVMGAGDVKFAILLGFFFGPSLLLQIFLLSNALAFLHGLAFVNRKHGQRLALGGTGSSSPDHRGDKFKKIPLAAYMALASIATIALQLPIWAPDSM